MSYAVLCGLQAGGSGRCTAATPVPGKATHPYRPCPLPSPFQICFQFFTHLA